MARKEPVVTLERFGSHSVSATQGGGSTVDKEEVYGYFRTTWQGKPVVVTMEANRYQYAGQKDEDTWSEWRVFANDARYVAEDDEAARFRGEPTTPTARTRLAELCRPYVFAWLEDRMTFAVAEGDDYASSRRRAFASLVRRMLHDLRPYSDTPTRYVRAFLVKYAHELAPEAIARFESACDAYDAFAAIINGEQ